MQIRNFYFYDKLNTEKFEKHHRNLFQSYYNLIIGISGTTKIVTDTDTFVLFEHCAILIKPFTFNKITLSDDAKCLFVGLDVELPSIRTKNLTADTENNVFFDVLNNNRWALVNIGYTLGTEHTLKTQVKNGKTVYNGLHLVFDPISANNVERIQLNTYLGAAGSLYFFPATVTDFNFDNAVARCDVEKAPDWESVYFDAAPFIRGGNISEFIIIYDSKSEGQIFFGELLFRDKNGSVTNKITASGFIDDIIFANILNKHGKIFPLYNSPALNNTLERFLGYFDTFSEKELSLASPGIITEFLFLLNRCDTGDSTLSNNSYNEIIQQIIAYIDENIYSRITIEDIAKHVNISTIYASQLFKRTMQTPLISYIRAKKMALVRQEILNGAKPYEIYFKYGFENYSSFYRAFTKIYHVSPSLINKQKK